MHPFTLSRPKDISAAVAAHAADAHLAFIAGGTDLIGLMKDRVMLPDRLLDINRLPDLAEIETNSDGGLRIGALARMSDVAANPESSAALRRPESRPDGSSSLYTPRHQPWPLRPQAGIRPQE